MTSYDKAMMQCIMEKRQVTVIIFKAGLIVVVAS